MSQYTMEDWLQMERELTRQRGLWGPPVGSDLDKWMLDMTEGFLRISILHAHFLYHQILSVLVRLKCVCLLIVQLIFSVNSWCVVTYVKVRIG